MALVIVVSANVRKVGKELIAVAALQFKTAFSLVVR